MATAYYLTESSEPLRKPVIFSAVAHLCLAVAMLAAALVRGQTVIWGEAGGGGAASLKLVSAASVPLPAPTIPTENRVATENKGLHYTEPAKPTPKQAPKVADEKAVALPARNAKLTPPPKKPAETQPPAEEPRPRR